MGRYWLHMNSSPSLDTGYYLLVSTSRHQVLFNGPALLGRKGPEDKDRHGRMRMVVINMTMIKYMTEIVGGNGNIHVNQHCHGLYKNVC